MPIHELLLLNLLADVNIHTSSGNQTPGCVLPSSMARANAATEYPTDLKDMNPIHINKGN